MKLIVAYVQPHKLDDVKQELFKEQVGKINFKTSRRSDIPLFETTIRYLGG